ncbi:hypothetical protein NKH16_30215, partial [Mesorhizobium sp. M1307]
YLQSLLSNRMQKLLRSRRVWTHMKVRRSNDHVIPDFDLLSRHEVALADIGSFSNGDLCIGAIEGKDAVDDAFFANRMLASPQTADAPQT